MKVSLFATCLVNVFYPKVGKSSFRLLQSLGCDVHVPLEQTCCGQPAYNNGFTEQTKAVARHLIELFSEAKYVVIPSGSCAAMIHLYADLFIDDPVMYEKARNLSAKTYELTDFLVNVLQVTDVGACLPLTGTYHPSCHMTRLLRVETPPNQLLENVEQLKLIDLQDKEVCCGFGGTFSIKMKEISKEMVDEKIVNIEKTGADVLIGADCGCLMNIEGRLSKLGKPIKVMHIAEVLANQCEVKACDNKNCR